jgi:hypothetical protein
MELEGEWYLSRFFVLFFWVVLGIEFRALHLLGRHSTT